MHDAAVAVSDDLKFNVVRIGKQLLHSVLVTEDVGAHLERDFMDEC